MRTTISIPDHLFDSAEKFAKRAGIARGELHAKAVRDFLEKRQYKKHLNIKVTEKLNEYYGHGDSNVDTVLQKMTLHTLRKDKW